MSRSYKFLGGVVFFLCMNLVTYSQKSPSNFGKVSEEELMAKFCPIDSNAHAYYLFDYGFSYFQYATTKVREGESSQNQKGFQLFHKRQFRLKILDNQGFEWADVAIPLYRDDSEEKIGTIKATTYNLENGKIVKTKLDRKDIFTEETSEFWIQKKFAMPAVKEGSVIEVEYTIISDFFFNLREWAFQSTIPVLRSEYHVHIPEYYIFNQTQRGYYPIMTESGTRNKQISITYSYDSGNKVKARESSTSTTEYSDNTFSFLAEDVPAFPSEEYLRTEQNYLSKIEFELQRTNFPGRPASYYTTTWEQVDDRLVNSLYFGKALSKNEHLTMDASALESSGAEGLALLGLAFNHTKQKLAWNGNNSKYTTNSLEKAYKEGSGNCADINLNLVALLGMLNFEVHPVVLSTQKNGIIHPSHPSLSRFNYVIAMVNIENETYLLDATDPYSEINLLPLRCLNDKGRAIGSPEQEWISLMDYRPYVYISNYAFTLADDMTLRGTRKLVLTDYASYQYKKRIKDFDNLEEYEKSFVDKQEANIENFLVEGLDSTESLTISYELTRPAFAENANEIIYFSPVFNPFFESNPFKLEKREYPVEYNHPYKIRESIFLTLPEGYTVSELPKAVNIKLPDNSAQYTFQVVQSGNGLIINTGVSINKSLFLSEEYEGIKQFFQFVIDKQNELVVLEKS